MAERPLIALFAGAVFRQGLPKGAASPGTCVCAKSWRRELEVSSFSNENGWTDRRTDG